LKTSNKHEDTSLIPSQSTSRATQAMPQNQPRQTHTQELELSHTFNYIYKTTTFPPLQGLCL